MTEAANHARAEGIEFGTAPTTSTILGWLCDAVRMVAVCQPELWTLGQGEETRVGQVLVELRKVVPSNWDVDVEYRRQGENGDPKRISGTAAPRERLARPDIVIHHRGDQTANGNLLVAEFKNYDRYFFGWDTDDGKKVVAIQDKFQTKVGALVSFGETDEHRGPRILWRDVNGLSGGSIAVSA